MEVKLSNEQSSILLDSTLLRRPKEGINYTYYIVHLIQNQHNLKFKNGKHMKHKNPQFLSNIQMKSKTKQ